MNAEEEGKNIQPASPVQKQSIQFSMPLQRQATLLERLRLSSSLADLKSRNLYRAMYVEFVGTFMLVLIGCAAGTMDPQQTKDEAAIRFSPSAVRVGLATGLSLATHIWYTEEASGGHINPCVSLSFLATRRVSLVRSFFYQIVQFVAGILAALVVKGLSIPGSNDLVGLIQPHPLLPPWKAFILEIITTFIMLIVTFSCVDPGRHDLTGSKPLAVGITVTISVLAFMPLSGCALNPARAFGSAVVTKNFTNNWLYWIGPYLGACLAGWTYEWIFATAASPARFVAFWTDPFYDADAPSYEKKVDQADYTNHSSKL